MSSKGARSLKNALKEKSVNTLMVYPHGRYVPREGDFIINWGSSISPSWQANKLNSVESVSNSTNKYKTFVKLLEHTVPTVTYSIDKEVAQSWVEEGNKVFCRTLLTGHSGKGIIIASTAEELVDAPLYTLAFPKTNEYRVHVWNGEVLDVQEKLKREGTGRRRDYDVWNHGNDFIFARLHVEPTPELITHSIKAVQALDLDFGAVDIGYNRRTNTYAVFEVNTAPGLTGTTLDKYVERIIRYV